MPWTAEGDNISFEGPVALVMEHVMNNYRADSEVSAQVDAGEYATCVAVVLRSMLMDGLEDEPEASEFIARLEQGVQETDEGVVVATFDMLDDISEHIALEALEEWLDNDEVKAAVAELALQGYEDEDIAPAE